MNDVSSECGRRKMCLCGENDRAQPSLQELQERAEEEAGEIVGSCGQEIIL